VETVGGIWRNYLEFNETIDSLIIVNYLTISLSLIIVHYLIVKFYRIVISLQFSFKYISLLSWKYVYLELHATENEKEIRVYYEIGVNGDKSSEKVIPILQLLRSDIQN